MKIGALVTPVHSFEDQKLSNEIFRDIVLTHVREPPLPLSPSVENVLAYFIDTEMFPKV